MAVKHARTVWNAVGLRHPTDLEIEVIAYMRGPIVRDSPMRGARANLLRVGDGGLISVADDLPHNQRRWAVAHELGHFEAHANVNFVGFCTGADLRADYASSGREPEANAFAAELLMPEHLYAKRVVSVAKVRWDPVSEFASEFQVSLTAAALRFVRLTSERVALYVCKDGKVAWSRGTRDFGRRLATGSTLSKWSLAHDFFTKGRVPGYPESVSADAWVLNARDSDEVVEHALAQPSYGSVMSLVWFPPR